jgi:co-chaperonin GroES (HSP10)
VEANQYTMSVAERDELIDRLCTEQYEAHRGFIPRYPWVFVRILQKEQKIGRIITPGNVQNKPVHEAIVLRVWPSFLQTKKVNGKTVTEFRESELELGDHILIPHWAGLPVRGFVEQHYRIVKEFDWSPGSDGGVFGMVEYDEPEHKPVEKLKALLSTAVNDLNLDSRLDDLVAEIEEHFLLVDRDARSLTISGR